MRYDATVGALMANDITVEILGRIGEAQIGEIIRTVTLGYAVLVQGQLNEDKPPPPRPGSMKFKSEKQRRFVMANYSRGNITVPYKRGTGSTLKGSETLNRSYRVDLTGDEAVLASAASYAPYVVGDQQADIHKGRWNTAANAVQTIQGNGSLDALVAQAMEKL
jgi:hypothetical protein